MRTLPSRQEEVHDIADFALTAINLDCIDRPNDAHPLGEFQI
jgi:hypothetical protein